MVEGRSYSFLVNSGGGTTPPRCKFDYVDVCGKTAGPARTFLEARTTQSLIEAVSAADSEVSE